MKKLLITLMVLLLTGCAGPLIHPTKGEAEGKKDWYMCEQEAVAYGSHMGTPSNPLVIGPRIRECMKMKYGWVEKTVSGP